MPEPIRYKRCSRCREVLPIENFHLSRDKRDGHGTYCKPCRKIIAKDYNAKKRQRIQEYRVQWAQEKAERILTSQQQHAG